MPDAKEIYDKLTEYGPLDSIIRSSEFSLGWFVENTLGYKGRPFRLMPFQLVILDLLWNRKFPMLVVTRGGSKTMMLALYALLKGLLIPNSKIIVVGAGFRQAKHVFRYIDEIYQSSPLLQESCGKDGGVKWASDNVYMKLGTSMLKGVPLGTGDKVRGERASVLISDEFASIPEDIFDHAIAPFTSVEADPVIKAEMVSLIKRLKKIGASKELILQIEKSQGAGNQIVISGSATYQGNHLAKRFDVYRSIIKSQGDKKLLKKALEAKAQLSGNHNYNISQRDIDFLAKTWDQYAVVQLPYTAIPEGFMDEAIISAEKAKMPYYRFQMEFLAQFPKDTDGFIKRSWIELATPKQKEEQPVIVELYGDPRISYVMGIDPARHNDNIAIVVLKLSDRGKELVYCDAWQKTQFQVSAHKIREVCKRFNIQYITMDQQGGGDAIYEWLCKKQDGIEDKDLIWVIPDQITKFGEKSDLGAPGRKILEMVNFPSWTASAAHSLAASIEQRDLLFPYKASEEEAYIQYSRHFNETNINESVKLKLQEDLWGLDDWEAEISKRKPRLGIMQHIEECINETCSVIRTVTPNGTEKFDLPKTGEQFGDGDARRRDRWSALLLANYAAKVFRGHGHKPKLSTPGHINTSTHRHKNSIHKFGQVAWFNPNR